MKRWFWKLAPLALAALLFLGCTSIPAKATPDDSLVIIKTEFINHANLSRGFEMYFNYSGDCPASWVGQYSWDFNVVVIKGPGVMLQSIGTRIQSRLRGASGEYEVNVPLPYEPGRIVIADFVFVQKIEQPKINTYSTSMSLRKITAQEKDDLMQALKADERFASWVR